MRRRGERQTAIAALPVGLLTVCTSLFLRCPAFVAERDTALPASQSYLGGLPRLKLRVSEKMTGVHRLGEPRAWGDFMNTPTL